MNLHKDFVDLIVKALPIDVYLCLQDNGPHLMVGGGFCRDVLTATAPKDIDIFCVSKDILTEVLMNFYTIDFRKDTGNAITLSNPDGPDIQFITRVFMRQHYAAILSFDFSICQVGVWYDPEKGWVGECSEAFLEDFPQFKMRYTAPERSEDPGASLLRMVKFVARGYSIEEREIARVLSRFYVQLLLAGKASYGEDRQTDYIVNAFSRIGYAGKRAEEVCPI